MALNRVMKTEATALIAKITPSFAGEPAVLRIVDGKQASLAHHEAALWKVAGESKLQLPVIREGQVIGCETVSLPPSLDHLVPGDVIRMNPPHGQLWVMYRIESPNNSMLLTERCNSWCVMCSQPPKLRDDSALAGDWLAAIPLMSPETQALGITGGEPTLLKDRFLELLQSCKEHLPRTAVHVLSNGRMFNYLSLAESVAAISHPDLVFGVPLYSEIAWRHDHVVQSKGAFDQTIRGLLNLARVRVEVELRVVIHRMTYQRLPQLASFIARNLPFTCHVALMGYEPIGFGRTNLDAIWIDPVDYAEELEQAVRILERHGVPLSIYNHQLCTLPRSLWCYARRSISDWKNIYLPACASCEVREQCGGFFHSAVHRHSRAIGPVPPESSPVCIAT